MITGHAGRNTHTHILFTIQTAEPSQKLNAAVEQNNNSIVIEARNLYHTHTTS